MTDVDGTSTFANTNDGGGNVRGDTDFDVSVLKIDLSVPASANCLTFDFRFLSEEFPGYVATQFNDAFIAELDSSTWTTSGSTISAPNNFAFDTSHNVVSINSTGLGGMSAANGAGTAFNGGTTYSADGFSPPNGDGPAGGATVLLHASHQVTPGAHTLYLSLFDQGDQILDSAVFLDNLVVGFVPNPAANCVPGAQPVNFKLGLTPATATNFTGEPHTVTATLTDTSNNPVASAPVQFTVTGPNATTGTSSTNGSGQATFTYTGANAGTDTISACYMDGAPICLAVASVTKLWVVPAITATGTPVSAVEGSPFSGKVASFTEPDPAAPASRYTALVHWGDGGTSPGTVTGVAGGPFTVNGTHTYAEEGSFPVSVVITDTATPSNTGTATSTATVADAALTSTCASVPVSPQAFSGATASFTDADPGGMVSDYTATIDWGDTTSSTGTITGGPGSGPYTVSGSHTYTSTGTFTVTTQVTDHPSTTTATCKVLIFAFAPGGGAFTIGDKNSAVGTAVTFWGSQWWKLNSLSGGAAPASFKGFAPKPATPSCGTGWSSGPGNSDPPPTGPLPDFMGVIVTSSASKSGPVVSGDTTHIVVVQTNPGYDDDPGHAGTGKVVAQLC